MNVNRVVDILLECHVLATSKGISERLMRVGAMFYSLYSHNRSSGTDLVAKLSSCLFSFFPCHLTGSHLCLTGG